jgi:hypothetical protein
MNRFGIHKNVLQAYSPDFADPDKVECYVPTRAEVFRMRGDKLFPILRKWFYHAPQELAPNEIQKQAVIKLLRSRPDADDLDLDITALQMPS